ncbi:MAG TPA: hypothetical protein VH638_06100 [Gemmatimonadaceae bacterium]
MRAASRMRAVSLMRAVHRMPAVRACGLASPRVLFGLSPGVARVSVRPVIAGQGHGAFLRDDQ